MSSAQCWAMARADRSNTLVGSYNVLSQHLVRRKMFPYASGNALKQKSRYARVLATIQSIDADVLSLQELDCPLALSPSSPWRAALASAGYDLAFTSADPGKAHGLGMMFKRDRLGLECAGEVPYALLAGVGRGPQERCTLALGRNAAQMMLFRIAPTAAAHKVGDNESYSMNGAPNGPLVCVSNTHLNWRHEDNWLKLRQVHALVASLAAAPALSAAAAAAAAAATVVGNAASEEGQKFHAQESVTPIMTGDFNLTPTTLGYPLLTRGILLAPLPATSASAKPAGAVAVYTHELMRNALLQQMRVAAAAGDSAAASTLKTEVEAMKVAEPTGDRIEGAGAAAKLAAAAADAAAGTGGDIVESEVVGCPEWLSPQLQCLFALLPSPEANRGCLDTETTFSTVLGTAPYLTLSRSRPFLDDVSNAEERALLLPSAPAPALLSPVHSLSFLLTCAAHYAAGESDLSGESTGLLPRAQNAGLAAWAANSAATAAAKGAAEVSGIEAGVSGAEGLARCLASLRAAAEDSSASGNVEEEEEEAASAGNDKSGAANEEASPAGVPLDVYIPAPSPAPQHLTAAEAWRLHSTQPPWSKQAAPALAISLPAPATPAAVAAACYCLLVSAAASQAAVVAAKLAGTVRQGAVAAAVAVAEAAGAAAGMRALGSAGQDARAALDALTRVERAFAVSPASSSSAPSREQRDALAALATEPILRGLLSLLLLGPGGSGPLVAAAAPGLLPAVLNPTEPCIGDDPLAAKLSGQSGGKSSAQTDDTSSFDSDNVFTGPTAAAAAAAVGRWAHEMSTAAAAVWVASLGSSVTSSVDDAQGEAALVSAQAQSLCPPETVAAAFSALRCPHTRACLSPFSAEAGQTLVDAAAAAAHFAAGAAGAAQEILSKRAACERVWGIPAMQSAYRAYPHLPPTSSLASASSPGSSLGEWAVVGASLPAIARIAAAATRVGGVISGGVVEAQAAEIARGFTSLYAITAAAAHASPATDTHASVSASTSASGDACARARARSNAAARVSARAHGPPAARFDEPAWTTCGLWCGTLDHVLTPAVGGSVDVVGLLSLPSGAEIAEHTALPSDVHGSDHVPIAAALKIRAD